MLTFFLLVLILSGALLVWEARTGNLNPDSRLEQWIRGILFFLAATVGGALLLRTAANSPLLAAALIPVTFLSLFRCVSLLRMRWNNAMPFIGLVLALIMSISVGLAALPNPLDQRVFIEKIFQRGSPSDANTIDPAGRRSSRV